jgi:hypothetical protein
MPIRIKLKDQETLITVRVDADQWAKAYEHARETGGMIEIHEDGRTLAINAGEIVLWESVPEDGNGSAPEPLAASAPVALS